MNSMMVFVPGRISRSPKPLDRYLPPIPENTAALWAEDNLPNNSWILDPFGSLPDFSVELARSGHKVLVAANNPVLRIILEMASNSPSLEEMNAALSKLASIRVRGDRLESVLRALYSSSCPICNANLEVEAFIWTKGENSPEGKIINCQSCGKSGETATNSSDRANAIHFSNDELHRSRAVDRIAHFNSPDRQYALEALNFHLPRSIFAIINLVNKLEGLTISGKQSLYLRALLLSAFDHANTLWPFPTERLRPKRLTIPPKYLENNIWMTLENAVSTWSSKTTNVPITYWPELPAQDGGICIYQGKIKDITSNLNQINFNAVVGIMPRPNQAFWTLSAFWSGWIWGREALSSFGSVLRRRRYDWSWHSSALSNIWRSIRSVVDKKSLIMLFIGELETSFLTSCISSALHDGYSIDGLAIRIGNNQAQISLSHPYKPKGSSWEISDYSEVFNHAAKVILSQTYEPVNFTTIAGECLLALSRQGKPTGIGSPGEFYNSIMHSFQQNFTFQKGFLRYRGTERSMDAGTWWLDKVELSVINNKYKNSSDLQPLSDRVETSVLEYLLENNIVNIDDLNKSMCSQYKGLLTPDSYLIHTCLESYAQYDSLKEGQWMLRQEDFPNSRLTDIEEIENILTELGMKLGFSISNDKGKNRVVTWVFNDNQIEYIFYISSTAELGKIVFADNKLPLKRFIILPGGRSNLAAYKLKSNPFLKEHIEDNWELVKFRHIRRMSISEHVNRANLDHQFTLDPLTYREIQMRML